MIVTMSLVAYGILGIGTILLVTLIIRMNIPTEIVAAADQIKN